MDRARHLTLAGGTATRSAAKPARVTTVATGTATLVRSTHDSGGITTLSGCTPNTKNACGVTGEPLAMKWKSSTGAGPVAV